MEEVHDISRQLIAMFHHILREANALTDGLGIGVFHSSISFDV